LISSSTIRIFIAGAESLAEDERFLKASYEPTGFHGCFTACS
jgi:hypothetical protein